MLELELWLMLQQHLFVILDPQFTGSVREHLILMKLLVTLICTCSCKCVSLCESLDVNVGVCTLLWHLEANQCPADYRC